MWFMPSSIHVLVVALTASQLLMGVMGAPAATQELPSRSPERGITALELERNAESKAHFVGKPLRTDLKNLNILDERLSIIVTDRATTSAITFSAVMGKLAKDMGVGVSELGLFRQWWDTANKKEVAKNHPGRAAHIFCDSQSKVMGLRSEINGSAYLCPRAEGKQADQNPFDDGVPQTVVDGCDKHFEDPPSPCQGYTAIAVSNRFDMADKDRGRHCGEFRIVFARNSGFQGADKICGLDKGRNLIIFEALMPNPNPPDSPATPTSKNIFVNLAGCRPIVEFWLSLSDPNMTTVKRGELLRDFFLKGLDGVGAVVDTRHYAGGPESGQIRTNQFMEDHWTLREFKTQGTSIVPATVKSNPDNSLFRSLSSESKQKSRAVELADYLVTKKVLDNLRGNPTGEAGERSVFTFAFEMTTTDLDHLNGYESDEGSSPDGDILQAFNACLKGQCPQGDVETKMAHRLKEANSLLTTNNIIRRIRTQTCAGCHHYSNGDRELGVECPEGWPSNRCFADDNVSRGIWPSTLGGFTHVAENEPGESDTAADVFDLSRLAKIDPDELKRIRSDRISHLSYMGPDGMCADREGSRYKISDTLKYVLMPPRFENMVLFLNEPPN